MSFALKSKQSLRKSIRRIARTQVDDALEKLTAAHKTSRDETVHETRLAFKKLRALLRLVRPQVGKATYRAENLCFRDAGRPLTEIRDARILIETLDGLIEHFKEHVASRSFEPVRKALQANLRAVRKRVLDEQNAFPVVGEKVRKARKRIKDWADIPNKWSSVGEGLRNVYRQARLAFKDAAGDPSVAKLHEWRKQTKYLRYQLEVLRPLWPERLEELANEADCMGDMLGDDHDLAILRQVLTDAPENLGDMDDREMPVALIDRRRAEFTEKALRLGERFFQDRPRDFAGRLKAYWKTWRLQAESQQLCEPLVAV